jgi:hypothetical protein
MPAKKNEQLDSAGMVAALAPTTAENYLGDPAVVEWLLRNYANQCIQRRAGMMDKRAESATMDVADAAKIADILVGKNPDYAPIKNWNKAGVIDRWMVDEFRKVELEVGGATAEERIRNVVVNFLCQMYDLMVAIENLPDDDAQMSVDALVQQFTWLIMGIPEWNKCD